MFIIGPDKRLKLSLLYPATTGRNFDEILRVVDSLQTAARKRVATPADWRVRHTFESDLRVAQRLETRSDLLLLCSNNPIAFLCPSASSLESA